MVIINVTTTAPVVPTAAPTSAETAEISAIPYSSRTTMAIRMARSLANAVCRVGQQYPLSMSDADRLTVTLVIVTAASTTTAALLGVMVGEWINGRRRQRATTQQVRRALGVFQVNAATARGFWGSLDDTSRVLRAERLHDAAAALIEVEVLIPELPQRVQHLVESAVSILRARHLLASEGAVDASRARRGWEATSVLVRDVKETVDAALREVLESSLFRWWFFRRWGGAKPSEVVQGYIDHLPGLLAKRAEREQQEATKRTDE
jgi:hypothetical protein